MLGRKASGLFSKRKYASYAHFHSPWIRGYRYSNFLSPMDLPYMQVPGFGKFRKLHDIADAYSMGDKAEKDSEAGAEKTAEDGSCVYHVKWIEVEGVRYAIVMQNENGPCPLLAVINVLLLRGQISLPDGFTEVNEKKLLQFIADCILRLGPKDLDESEQANYEQNVSDVLTLIPSLPKGLDVNIHFTGVKKFEYTPACALFDMLNIPLMHGWIIDSADQQLLQAVDGLSYNQIMEKLVSMNDDDSEIYLMKNFLDSNASQLTTQGIAELLSSLNDGEIAVLFRNNHFHTLSKHQDALYVLVTDMGFLGEPMVVWETLDCVDGNSTFVNAAFSVPPKPDTVVDESADYLLALSIQEEEKKERMENRNPYADEIGVPAEEHDVQRDVSRAHASPTSAQPKRPNKNNNCLIS